MGKIFKYHLIHMQNNISSCISQYYNKGVIGENSRKKQVASAFS